MANYTDIIDSKVKNAQQQIEQIYKQKLDDGELSTDLNNFFDSLTIEEKLELYNFYMQSQEEKNQEEMY